MRALFGSGTPREAASAKSAILFVIQFDAALAIAIVANIEGKPAILVIIVAPETSESDLITGLLGTKAAVAEVAFDACLCQKRSARHRQVGRKFLKWM